MEMWTGQVTLEFGKQGKKKSSRWNTRPGQKNKRTGEEKMCDGNKLRTKDLRLILIYNSKVSLSPQNTH